MINRITFYKLCIFFNIITNIYFMTVSSLNYYEESVQKIIYLLFIVNLLKMACHSLIIRFFTNRIYNNMNRYLSVNILLEFLKIMTMSILIFKQNIICLDFSKCIIMAIVYLNYFINICEYIFTCIRICVLDILQNFNAHVNHNDIYIEIQPNYETNVIICPTSIICSICLEEQKTNEIWNTLRCSHQFHKDCIIEWLSIKKTCPVCRITI